MHVKKLFSVLFKHFSKMVCKLDSKRYSQIHNCHAPEGLWGAFVVGAGGVFRRT